MAGSILARALGVLELLAEQTHGMHLQEISDRLLIPKSGAHRLLAELIQLRYVIQDKQSSCYLLTTRLMSLGFRQLGGSGIVEIAQPVLNRLAISSNELVRLAVLDGDRLPFVAKAQGAGAGLRYDPDMGIEAALFCSATGHAWLASLSDEEAITKVVHQGFTHLEQRGRCVPATIAAVLDCLAATRERGYAQTVETWAPGMASMAATVVNPATAQVTAVISISGPSVRMTEAVMQGLAGDLLTAALELSELSPLSQYLYSLNP